MSDRRATRIRDAIRRARLLADDRARLDAEVATLRSEVAELLTVCRVRPLRHVAADAGVSTSHVYQIQRGRTTCGPDDLARVLGAAFEERSA